MRPASALSGRQGIQPVLHFFQGPATTPSGDHECRQLRDSAARVLCYILGPFSIGLFLLSRRYGAVWSIRFHVFHSALIAAVWALIWTTLRGVEEIVPWFLSVVARELRFTLNIGFVLVWLTLLFTAYSGGRCATLPFVHGLAVRLARKYQPAS